MTCSPARLAANRANSLKSTGPRTEEGKGRSRGNALKHGLAGEGVVLAAADRAEADRLIASVEADLRPGTDLERALARRVGLMAARLGRCAEHEAAAASDRALSAGEDFDEARLAEAERLMDALGDDPASAVRQLRRTPEGVDRMIAAWRALGEDVSCPAEPRWGAEHRRLAENLTGRRPGQVGLSRVEALARAIRGDFTLLGPGEGAGLGDARRSAWAREQMAGLIEAEVAGLIGLREGLDHDRIAARRDLAPRLAAFDRSRQGELARRYEAAAERGLYRALRELRLLRDESRPEGRPCKPVAPPAPEPEEAPEADPLASFRAEDLAALLPVPPAEARRPGPSRPAITPPGGRLWEPSGGPRDASTIVVGRP